MSNLESVKNKLLLFLLKDSIVVKFREHFTKYFYITFPNILRTWKLSLSSLTITPTVWALQKNCDEVKQYFAAT